MEQPARALPAPTRIHMVNESYHCRAIKAASANVVFFMASVIGMDFNMLILGDIFHLFTIEWE